jgi:hypothetical protein
MKIHIPSKKLEVVELTAWWDGILMKLPKSLP